MSDPVGAAPETREPRFLWLLFGASAAPLAWLGQVMLNYGLTTLACYPGDHPTPPVHGGLLVGALVAINLLALALGGAGGAVSWWHWRRAKSGRNRFLALWGILSSLCFLAAVLFNAIASFVPPCRV